MVEEDYLLQSSVSPEMRAVLVDWLLQVEYSCLCYHVVTMYVVMGHNLGQVRTSVANITVLSTLGSALFEALSQETLYLAISLLDTILDKRDVEADKLQLVGIVLAFILDLSWINVDACQSLI